MTREELIQLIEDAIRPESQWSDRDSERAHRQLGECLVLLKCGCEFNELTEGSYKSDDRTHIIEVTYKGFDWFEMHEMGDDTFYVPTRQRLDDVGDGDWYC